MMEIINMVSNIIIKEKLNLIKIAAQDIVNECKENCNKMYCSNCLLEKIPDMTDEEGEWTHPCDVILVLSEMEIPE